MLELRQKGSIMFRPLVLLGCIAVSVSAQSTQGKTPVAIKGDAAAAATVNKSRSNVKNNLVMQPDGKLSCVDLEGRPCSDEDIKALNGAVPGIKAVTNKGNGILCESADGKPCNATQVEALNAAIHKGWDLKTSKAGRSVNPRDLIRTK